MNKSAIEHQTELAQQGIHLPKGDVRVGGYGDTEALSNSLISLIQSGIKRGTCSLVWSWEYDGEPAPKVGDIEIVLDWHERPMLVTRITKIEIVPFDCVGTEFAASEGEGDLSLAYWRVEHWRFFTEECKRIGRVPDLAMPLVCESFEVLCTLDP